MKRVLTEKMLQEIFTALDKGEPFEYSDANTHISINPNKLSIQYCSSTNEVEDFIQYCDNLDDELFVEVCESFDDGELKNLQDNLDTPSYKETITTFKQRVAEIANTKLTAIINDASAEIERQTAIITNAKSIITDITKEVEQARLKYAI